MADQHVQLRVLTDIQRRERIGRTIQLGERLVCAHLQARQLIVVAIQL